MKYESSDLRTYDEMSYWISMEIVELHELVNCTIIGLFNGF